MKNIEAIERKFLLGGCEDSKKTYWVSWSKVCLPKKLGGLGVKNIELFNMSLLAKWRWRFCMDQTALWYELLFFRYGSFLNGGKLDTSIPHNASRWLKDMFLLEKCRGGGWICHFQKLLEES